MDGNRGPFLPWVTDVDVIVQHLWICHSPLGSNGCKSHQQLVSSRLSALPTTALHYNLCLRTSIAVIRLCQQKLFIGNYIHRVIIAGSQCIIPTFQRSMHIWQLSDVKMITTDLQKCTHKKISEKRITQQMSKMIQVWTLDPEVKGSSDSVRLWALVCPLRIKGH